MIEHVRQIPLDLGHRAALGREDFLVAPCNQDAVGWIDRWPAWPGPALVLHGPAACGKTHLGAVWCKHAKATWVDAKALAGGDANGLAAQGKNLVLDNLDPWVGERAAETVLFHLYNIMKDRGTAMLMTMRAAPGQIAFALPDLSSRLRAAPAAGISAPDDAVLSALLVKLFADRQMNIGADCITYVLPRMERSFAAARDLVARADALALAEKKPVTLSVLRRILADQA